MFTLRRASGEVIPLVRNAIVFGRDPSACDAILHHPSAARRHFQINADISRSAMTIADLGSAAGTFVNGIRLAEDAATRLSANDQITYGTAQDDSFVVEMFANRNEKLDKSLSRLAWLKTEIGRLKAREGIDGLTENQQRSLDKYEAEFRNVEKIIEDHAKEIESQGDSGSGNIEGDDAFWDNVVVNDLAEPSMIDFTEKKSKLTSEEPMTYASLLRKLDDLKNEEATLQTEIRRLKELGNQEAGEEEEDELDKFMAANERDIQTSDLQKAENRLEELSKERKRVESLANVARPALERISTSVSTNQEPQASGSSKPPSPKPQAARPTAPQAASKISLASTLFGKSQPARAPKSAAQSGIDFRVASDVEDAVKRGRFELDQEDSDATWRPPTNQKGDGRTKANDRFGY